jgi:branched-chain amino acid transport system permease protein
LPPIGGIYALLALSLNLIWGGAGMVNLGLAGFFAVGAYASALATTTGHLPILAAGRWRWWPAGGAGCGTYCRRRACARINLAIVTWGSPRWCAWSPRTRSG